MKKKLFLTFIILNILSFPAFSDEIDDTFDFNNSEISGFTSVATTDDSRAVFINPGAIGIKNGIEGFLSTSIMSSFSQNIKPTDIPKSDQMGFSQFNAAAMYGSFNGAFQQFNTRNNNLDSLRKFFAGIAYPITEGISAGVSWVNVESIPFEAQTPVAKTDATTAITDNSYKSGQSMNIGILTRPMELLSLGVVAKNVNTPVINKTKIRRSYLVSIALRPPIQNFSDRMTLVSDAEWVEGSDIKRTKIKFGLNTEIVNGVVINGFAISDFSFKNFSFGFQAGINFPYLSFGYANNFSNIVKDSAYLRFTTSKERNLLENGDENNQ
ncbi:MAG: hypothetical protein AABZ74_17585 [Cyanobacteriota bacterium]